MGESPLGVQGIRRNPKESGGCYLAHGVSLDEGKVQMAREEGGGVVEHLDGGAHRDDVWHACLDEGLRGGLRVAGRDEDEPRGAHLP